MRIESLLPFVRQIKPLSVRYEARKKSEITYPKKGPQLSDEFRTYAETYFRDRMVPCYMPLSSFDVLIPGLDSFEWGLFRLLSEDYPFTVRVIEIDYLSLLSQVEFPRITDSGGVQEEAFLEGFTGFHTESLTVECVEALRSYKTYDDTKFLRDWVRSFPYDSYGDEALFAPSKAPVSGIDEAASRDVDLESDEWNDLDVDALPELEPVEELVRNYLQYRTGTERIPVLMGHTGVAKSALIKKITRSLTNPRRRFVDFRCAFIDKLDIEGMKHKVIDPEAGTRFSDSSPFARLFNCTDEYMEYCSTLEPKVEAMLNEIEQTDAQNKSEIKTYKTALNKIRWFQRWPVILFDEITRAMPAIQNAFVQILNQKKFKGYNFTKARILGATNHPVDMPDHYQLMYMTINLKDAGIRERYEPIEIRPEDVYKRWRVWAADSTTRHKEDPLTGMPLYDREGNPVLEPVGGNFHPLILEFITDGSLAYDIDQAKSVIDKGMAKGTHRAQDIGITPFPNFRTWEFVNQHLKGVLADDTGKTILNTDIIKGFLGENSVSADFISFLKDRLPKGTFERRQDSRSDMLTEAVQSSMQTGIPVCMLGMTSIGKTTRVKELARLNHAFVITINLAQKDRVDIMGAPQDVPLYDDMVMVDEDGRSGGGVDRDHPLVKLLESSVPEGLPKKLTMIAPDRDFYRKIVKALGPPPYYDEGPYKKVVIFFDELNRADSLTMAAVLEAVSDNRFGGVVFPKDKVVIISACNYGQKYAGAGQLDPAISGRFSMITKMSFDDSDIESIIKYMENDVEPERKRPAPYDSRIVDFIKSLSIKEAKEMFASVEARTLHEAAPSLRSFSDLNGVLTKVKKTYMTGKLIPQDTINKEFMYEPLCDNYKTLLNTLKSLPSNWAGYGTAPLEVSGRPPREVRDYIESTIKALEQVDEIFMQEGDFPASMGKVVARANKALTLVIRRNTKAFTLRQRSFLKILGPQYSTMFLAHYNVTTGDEPLTIPELRDRADMDRYVDRLLIDPSTDVQQTKVVRALREFYIYWGRKKSANSEFFRDFMRAIMDRADPVVTMPSLMMYRTSPAVKKYIDNTFDLEFTREVLGSLAVFKKLPGYGHIDDAFKRWEEARA